MVGGATPPLTEAPEDLDGGGAGAATTDFLEALERVTASPDMQAVVVVGIGACSPSLAFPQAAELMVPLLSLQVPLLLPLPLLTPFIPLPRSFVFLLAATDFLEALRARHRLPRCASGRSGGSVHAPLPPPSHKLQSCWYISSLSWSLSSSHCPSSPHSFPFLDLVLVLAVLLWVGRSEERRVGKECRL